MSFCLVNKLQLIFKVHGYYLNFKNLFTTLLQNKELFELYLNNA